MSDLIPNLISTFSALEPLELTLYKSNCACFLAHYAEFTDKGCTEHVFVRGCQRVITLHYITSRSICESFNGAKMPEYSVLSAPSGGKQA